MKRLDTDLRSLPFKEATKETPAVNPLPYALVPATLAVTAILVVFITVGLFSLAVGWSVKVPLAAAGVVAAALFVYAALTVELVPYSIERIVNHDLDGDGFVGEPPPPSEPVRIIVEKEDGNEIWLNFDSEEMRSKAMLVAAFILNGSPFSEKALSGTGRPLTRSEFYTLRDLFMFHELVRWKNPKHPTLGLELTPLGRSTVRKLAGLSTTPPRIPAPRSSGYALPEPVGEGE